MRLRRSLSRILMALAVALVPLLLVAPQQAQADNSPKPAPSAAHIYVNEGQWVFNNRVWHTWCEAYSQTKRCTTNIWGTAVTYENGKYQQVNKWVFNNLTYLPMERSVWGGNILVNSGEHTVDGRKWKTECDTSWTGANACRSQIWATVHGVKDGRYQTYNTWVFNNMVHLIPCAVTGTRLSEDVKETTGVDFCLQSKLDPNWLAVQFPSVDATGANFTKTAFYHLESGTWKHQAHTGLNATDICDFYEKSLPHAYDLADTISYCFASDG